MKRVTQVAGEPAAERLMRSINRRAQENPDLLSDGAVTPTQVSLVLMALADHTSISEALGHRSDSDNAATSVGRWLHDVVDDLEDMELTWTQPVCVLCWVAQEGDRQPHRVLEASTEICCFCGQETSYGIFARHDPRKLPFPKSGAR